MKGMVPQAGRWLVLIGSLVLVVGGLKVAQGFFLPILLAFFVATVSLPVTRWLVNRGLPRALAVLITVLMDFSFIVAVLLLGLTLAGELQDKWNTKYAAELSRRVQTESFARAETLSSWGVHDAQQKINEVVKSNLQNLQNIRFERVWDLGTGLLNRVIGFFATFVLVLILTVFMLLEAHQYESRLRAIRRAHGPNIARLLSATKDIQRYLAIKTVVSLATGILAGILCWAAGLDFYILWGILAYALNYIPVIGSIVAGVPPTVLALVVSGVPDALVVAGGYLLINNFLGNFLEPLFVGRRFGISTLVVVVAVMFWGWVWGPLGMLIAVPITMMLKVMLEGSEEFRWISVAISSVHSQPSPHRPPPKPTDPSPAALPEPTKPTTPA